MRFKLLASIVLIALIVGAATAWRSTSIATQSREPTTIKVVIDQLPTNDGRIPIEIVQPIVSSTKPNQIEGLTYIVRNTSDRAISALAVSKNITYEAAGNLYTTSLYATLDYAFHPDFHSAKLLEPGSETTMEASGPMRFDDDVVIKEITLRVDYLLFEDNTTFGSGGEGEQKVNLMREGARKYKDWLGHDYLRNGKSVAMTVPVLQQRQLPEQLKLNLDEILGADRYRLLLLKTFQTKGAADVEKLLTAGGMKVKIKS